MINLKLNYVNILKNHFVINLQIKICKYIKKFTFLKKKNHFYRVSYIIFVALKISLGKIAGFIVKKHYKTL